MPEPPRVHVVTIAYNAGDWLARLAPSVLDLPWPERWIVVDDGSDTPAAETLGRFDDPRLVVRHRENGGEAAARNTAIEASLELADADAARGDDTWLLFIDADDRLLPEAGPALADAHAADADAMIGAKLERFDDGRTSLREPPDAWRDATLPAARDVFRFLAVMAATGMAVRHRALRGPDAPRWDPEIPMSCDIEFLYRVAGRGRVFVTSRPAVEYRKHASGASLSGRRNVWRRVAGFERIARLHHAPDVDALLEAQARWILNQASKHEHDPDVFRRMLAVFRRHGWRPPLKPRLRAALRFARRSKPDASRT